MPKNKSKKTKLNVNNIYSEAFPPNKDGSRSNISQYSNGLEYAVVIITVQGLSISFGCELFSSY